MTRNITLILALGAALVACENKEDHTVVAGGPADPMAAELNKAGPVELPPSIVASKTYRCKDNSIVSIDWLSNGTTNSANATPKGGSLISLTQAVADGDYTGTGVTLKGKPTDATVTYNGQSCKA